MTPLLLAVLLAVAVARCLPRRLRLPVAPAEEPREEPAIRSAWVAPSLDLVVQIPDRTATVPAEEAAETVPFDVDPDPVADLSGECGGQADGDPWYDDSTCWGCAKGCTFKRFVPDLDLGTPAERLSENSARLRRDALSTGPWTGEPIERAAHKRDTFDGSKHATAEFMASIHREKLAIWREKCETCGRSDAALACAGVAV